MSLQFGRIYLETFSISLAKITQRVGSIQEEEELLRNPLTPKETEPCFNTRCVFQTRVFQSGHS